MSESLSMEDLAEEIGIGVHTGLRKGTEAEGSSELWNLIDKSDKAWSEAVEYAAEGILEFYNVTPKEKK